MRVVLLVAALFAVCAVVDVSARRIHKMKAALVAAEDEEVSAELPFDGDYWQAVKPDVSKALAAEAKKAQLTTADLLSRFFAKENIELAQQQGASVVAQIGTYTAAAILKQCNEGTCDDKWTDVQMTGNLFRGGEGNIVLTCTVPTDLKTAVCNLDVLYNGNQNNFFSCNNIGGATKKCSNPRPQRYSSGAGSWMSNDFIINTAAPNSALNDVYLTKDGLTANWKYFGLDSNKKLTFSSVFAASANWAAYKPVVSPAAPAPAPDLVAASKAKALTTAQLLAKFFTPDNIQLAQMQGSTVPVRATIASFAATAVSRSCNTGLCGAYAPVEMTGNLFRGGEGSIVLSCSVPADLSKAQCDITVYYNGKDNTLMTCPNIGAGGKCSNPRPQRYSSGAGAWMSNDFITTTVEAAEVFFTNDQLAVHFRYRGNDSNKKLVFADFTLLSTPLTDFGVPPKTNCLSKTTAEAVIQAAAAKKGLKSAIVLQKEPVAQLISKAPYKTVEDAVTAIKGIGPRNVVYVSFMWNFSC